MMSSIFKDLNLKKIIPWLLVLLWMTLIFNLSNQPVERSNNLSKGITKVIIETVEKVAPEKDFNPARFNHIVRKNAHFFAYLILGILVVNGLRISGIIGYKGFFLALLICVLYAISDEVHQLFVPGRGGQLRDVIIDSTGALVGILIYNGFIKIKEKAIEV